MPNPGIPAVRRQQIIEAAYPAIADGATIREVAAQHGIHFRTLQTWLYALGDDYAEFRSRVIDAQLIHAIGELDDAASAMANAATEDVPRARAVVDARDRQLRSAQWLAERRDRRYASKQEVSVTHRLDLADALAEADRRAGLLVDNTVIEGSCSQDTDSSDESDASDGI